MRNSVHIQDNHGYAALGNSSGWIIHWEAHWSVAASSSITPAHHHAVCLNSGWTSTHLGLPVLHVLGEITFQLEFLLRTMIDL